MWRRLLFVCIMMFSCVSFVDASTINQTNWFTPWSTCYVLDSSSNYDADAFGFSPTQSGSLASVEVYWKKANSPSGNSWLELWSDSSNLPNAQIGTTSATIANSSLSTTWTSYNLAFPGKPSLTANTHYWIVAKSTSPQTGSNGSCIGGKDGLMTGMNWNINNANILHGSVWATAASNTQKSFQIYLDITPSPTPSNTPTPTTIPPTATSTPSGGLSTSDVAGFQGMFTILYGFLVIILAIIGYVVFK